MTKIKNYFSKILQLLLVAVFGIIAVVLSTTAIAEEEQHSNVIADLSADETFNISDYPAKYNDYSIEIIQIAESTDNELFVYTYQPSQKTTYLVATEINMSLSENVDDTQLYGLTLLNNNGVFCKYKVNDFKITNETVRYYNITSIYREWQKGIDKPTGNDNTKNAVAFAVGKLYKATTENGATKYLCEHIEVVQIINPFADFLQYYNGYHLVNYKACRSHYVAFSTDKQIDTLQEVTVAYDWETFSQSGLSDWKSNGIYHEKKTIYGTQKGENAADGWYAKKYEWERIQTVNNFIKTEDLTDETKRNLECAQWVLRFLETELVVNVNSGILGSNKHTDVSNVTILRLKFVSNGKVYDLGAVSDKMTEDDNPGNNNTHESASLWEWLARLTGIPEWVWKLLAALIPIAIILPILYVIFPVVGQVLSLVFSMLLKAIVWLLKSVLWLVCLPFNGIAAIILKIKDK